MQYLKVAVDRLAAGRYGLNGDDVQNELKSLLEGRTVGTVIDQGPGAALMRGPEALRASPADFAALRLATPAGGSLPLAAVARLERVDGPVKVDRENAQRYVVVQSNVRGRDLVGFVDDARAVAGQLKAAGRLPPGLGRPIRKPAAAAARLAVVVPVAVGLIFFLLFSTFGSRAAGAARAVQRALRPGRRRLRPLHRR